MQPLPDEVTRPAHAQPALADPAARPRLILPATPAAALATAAAFADLLFLLRAHNGAVALLERLYDDTATLRATIAGTTPDDQREQDADRAWRRLQS